MDACFDSYAEQHNIPKKYTKFILKSNLGLLFLAFAKTPPYAAATEVLNTLGLLAALVMSVAASGFGLFSHDDLIAAEKRYFLDCSWKEATTGWSPFEGNPDPVQTPAAARKFVADVKAGLISAGTKLGFGGQVISAGENPYVQLPNLGAHYQTKVSAAMVMLSVSLLIVIILLWAQSMLDWKDGDDEPCPSSFHAYWYWARLPYVVSVLLLVVGCYVYFQACIDMCTLTTPGHLYWNGGDFSNDDSFEESCVMPERKFFIRLIVLFLVPLLIVQVIGLGRGLLVANVKELYMRTKSNTAPKEGDLVAIENPGVESPIGAAGAANGETVAAMLSAITQKQEELNKMNMRLLKMLTEK